MDAFREIPLVPINVTIGLPLVIMSTTGTIG